MSRVEKHPTDEGKFQSTFDDYGHGEGNGKSRNAIYKRYKKLNEVKEEKPIEIFVDNVIEEETEWSEIKWSDDNIEEETGDDFTKEIPDPMKNITDSKAGQVAIAAQGQVVRYGFKALDRLITHWGRGVMSSDDWEIL